MIRYKWSKAQWEFIMAGERSVALLGGKRSGKTTALCRRVVRMMWGGDEVGLLGRYKLGQSEDALMGVLEGMMRGYEWRRERVVGGWDYGLRNRWGRWSVVRVRSLRDIRNVSGMTLSFVGISEVDDEHIREEHWVELCNRLTLGGRQSIFCEGTRSGNCDVGGWVLRRVERVIWTTTEDNRANLPVEFWEYLSNLNEVERARVVTGMYDVSRAGQVVYPEFDIKVHSDDLGDVVERWLGSGCREVWVGVDCPHQLAAVIGVVYRGKIYIIGEVYDEDNLSIIEFLDKVQGKIVGLLGGRVSDWVVNAYIDPSGGVQQNEEHITAEMYMLERGWGVRYGSQRQKAREEAVKKLLLEKRIVVSGGCSVLISGFISGYVRRYRGGVLSDKPEKNKYSHLQDALAYLCSGLLRDMGDGLDAEAEAKRYDSYDYKSVVRRYEEILNE